VLTCGAEVRAMAEGWLPGGPVAQVLLGLPHHRPWPRHCPLAMAAIAPMDPRILGKLGRSAANRLARASLATLPCVTAWRGRHRGFTVVELILAVTIIGILGALALLGFQGYRDRIKLDQAVGDLVVLSVSIGEFKADNKRFPTDLAEIGKDTMRDPWGHAYQYIDHSGGSNTGLWRKDKNIHPINTDFDLYSMGKDGTSVAPLTANPSRDDIIRANDGAFVGLVSVYDP
jgi:general secretion pathway protein G